MAENESETSFFFSFAFTTNSHSTTITAVKALSALREQRNTEHPSEKHTVRGAATTQRKTQVYPQVYFCLCKAIIKNQEEETPDSHI